MNILKNIVRVGLIVTALSFNLVSCDYLDVVPPEQAGATGCHKDPEKYFRISVHLLCRTSGR